MIHSKCFGKLEVIGYILGLGHALQWRALAALAEAEDSGLILRIYIQWGPDTGDVSSICATLIQCTCKQAETHTYTHTHTDTLTHHTSHMHIHVVWNMKKISLADSLGLSPAWWTCRGHILSF